MNAASLSLLQAAAGSYLAVFADKAVVVQNVAPRRNADAAQALLQPLLAPMKALAFLKCVTDHTDDPEVQA